MNAALDCANTVASFVPERARQTCDLQTTVSTPTRLQTWNGSFLKASLRASVYNRVEDRSMKMNVPAIIALTAIVTSLLVASCLYICKKRYVEPLEAAQQNSVLQ